MITTLLCFGAGVLTAAVMIAVGHSMESGRQPRHVLAEWLVGHRPRPVVLQRQEATLTVGEQEFPVTVEVRLELPKGCPAGRLLERKGTEVSDFEVTDFHFAENVKG